MQSTMHMVSYSALENFVLNYHLIGFCHNYLITTEK